MSSRNIASAATAAGAPVPAGPLARAAQLIETRQREADAHRALSDLFPHLRLEAYNALRELFPSQSAQ